MLDLGWPELFIVMVVAVLVIGPSEIPGIMRTLGRLFRRVQYIRYAFSQQFEEFMEEHDLDDIRNSVNFEAKDFDESAADEDVVAEEPKKNPKKNPKKKPAAKKKKKA